jgi:hemerythrin-like domain-containing protein
MDTIYTTLKREHTHCDDLFAAAESSVAENDWNHAALPFEAFRSATLLHFEREEAVLFPEFETHTGMHGGPTYVMRAEHDQMRDSLEAMASALERRDAPDYLNLADGLLMLMRQHNMKEEQILYPMADQALDVQLAEILNAMSDIDILPPASS